MSTHLSLSVWAIIWGSSHTKSILSSASQNSVDSGSCQLEGARERRWFRLLTNHMQEEDSCVRAQAVLRIGCHLEDPCALVHVLDAILNGAEVSVGYRNSIAKVKLDVCPLEITLNGEGGAEQQSAGAHLHGPELSPIGCLVLCPQHHPLGDPEPLPGD